MLTSQWIARLRPSGDARMRLICFPHAGGGGATFRSWGPDLPDGIDLCAVRLPGRESRLREPLLTRMEDVVGQLGDVVEGLTDVPYALFGYCSGALTAFELARLLERAGRPPAHLFVCACPSPAAVDRDGGVHKMSGPELADHLRALGIIPPVIIDDPGLFAMFEPSVRADYEVFESDTYRSGPPLRMPITVFGADDDPSTTVPTMLRWRAETSGEFALRLFPGDHSFFEQDRRSILRTVAAELTAGTTG
ncbi:thioesterase domain-containing protein [Micromonospora sp. NPDC000207]|uniref:thioesterase II family protein n=1 Tax=Micromonospora sp. NPDC000207 TaxID=3154246 RepID=UPI00331DB2AF